MEPSISASSACKARERALPGLFPWPQPWRCCCCSSPPFKWNRGGVYKGHDLSQPHRTEEWQEGSRDCTFRALHPPSSSQTGPTSNQGTPGKLEGLHLDPSRALTSHIQTTQSSKVGRESTSKIAPPSVHSPQPPCHCPIANLSNELEEGSQGGPPSQIWLQYSPV